ncbi:Methylated-DNA--protein-cysteine methyltransferase [Clavibacter michiganensis subsp. michiganensis]|uniref:Methylated-DNA--protein-cysteine methyltransferase n=1 Tax=Clavibacter michiganensis subsp. michiganensis TaxID=33013 RepID=A0A251XP02_CLAMM|nr:Methylated-DNA--protein-cysteine methyltransferase [Clavibacter michiganensis subsp. michiganensis]OUE04778.1 Methylated-DNA--protein-cysteine methyltransferase [Clavibacter michiganensis subsp. michiganensis]
MMQPFDRVVTEHGAVVLRVCRAVLGGHADAEDAWSETFLSALVAYPPLGPRADVRAWLVTIAHRKALDAIRARGRRAIPVDEVPERVSDLGVPDSRDPDLWRAVAALPSGSGSRSRTGTSAGCRTRRSRRSSAALRRPCGARRRTGWRASGGRWGRIRPRPRASHHPHPHQPEEDDRDRSRRHHPLPRRRRARPCRPDRARPRRPPPPARRPCEADGALDVGFTTIDSPVGPLLLAATDRGLIRVAYSREDHDTVLGDLARRLGPRILRAPKRLDQAARELDEYFAGRRRAFDLPLDRRLSTGFRDRVQRLLPEIPYGSTRTYREVAETAGSPAATRAVGTACSTNPLPVVIPCHRVLRSDGTLGGYIGGLAAKTTLLELEGRF